MKHMGQMILLMRVAPQRHTLARFAQMNWLLTRAPGHRAPPTVAHPAELTADIAYYYADIRALVLIAHSVHLCITVLAAQHAHVTDLRTSGDVLMTQAGSSCAFVCSL